MTDLAPTDFAALRVQLAKIRGPVGLGNEIQRSRSVFKFAFDDGIIASPIRFGMGFNKPTRKTLRIERAKKGARDLQANQIRKFLAKATLPLKAMTMLAINAGFGNNDCATLPLEALDLKGGWVTYSRPKTGVARRAKL